MMKEVYNVPEMRISIFNKENIIKTSGMPAKDAVEISVKESISERIGSTANKTTGVISFKW